MLLLDLSNRVASDLDLRQVFRAISSEIRRIFKCDFVGGAPPVRHNQMSQGFRGSHRSVAGKEELSKADIDYFVESIFGEAGEAFLRHAVARADGRFRKRLFEASRAGEGVDERLIVESCPVPLAVVNEARIPW